LIIAEKYASNRGEEGESEDVRIFDETLPARRAIADLLMVAKDQSSGGTASHDVK
jgi:hypothetical protein